MADASGNNANYYTALRPTPSTTGKYTTVVGEFQNSASPYGTFDQGGNVWEWNEAIVYQDSMMRIAACGAGRSATTATATCRRRHRNYDDPYERGFNTRVSCLRGS